MRYALFLVLIALLGLSPVQDSWAKAKRKAPKQTEEIGTSLPVLRPIQAIYDVYVGGLHLLRATYDMEQNNGRYHVKADVRTHGLWGYLFPWEATVVSDGRLEGSRFVPEEHYNANTWKKSTKKLWMHFDKKGNIVTNFDPPETPDERRNIVTAEQQRGALDPLTAILQLLGDLALNKTCQATEPVFDGKRRFDLTNVDKGFGFTDPDDYGFYKGRARLCDVHFKMVAGEWKDRERSKFWQHNDGTPGRDPFEIWLAALAPDLPEIAVRAESSSFFGRIVVHLNDWKYADKKTSSAPQ